MEGSAKKAAVGRPKSAVSKGKKGAKKPPTGENQEGPKKRKKANADVEEEVKMTPEELYEMELKEA